MEIELGVMDLQANKLQGSLTNTRSEKKLGKILFHVFQKEHGSADNWTLGFEPLELCESKCLLFSAIQFVALYSSYPGKLIHLIPGDGVLL